MLTRGAQVTGVAVCGLCLTWISVGLRFYVRIGIQRFFGREDWLTVASMILFTLLCVLLLIAVNYGLGAHRAAIPQDDLTILLKYIFISELLYVATTVVTKLSIGVYFLRLAGKRYQVYIIYAVMAVVSVYSTMYFFFLIFQCHPVQYLWTEFEGAQGTCVGVTVLANTTYAHAALSAVTDWAFGILPVFFVWKMKMNPRTKLSVILILSLGFFASTATMVRIVYIEALTQTTDYSWEGINLVKWSMVEPAIGITAAAIATLRPLFSTFLLRKRPGHSHDDDSDDRKLAESRQAVTPNARDGESYGFEFAEMLGLKRVGVTTVISAQGGDRSWKARLRNPLHRTDFFASSQIELNDGASQEELTAPDWNAGITKTTVITIDQ